MVVTNQQLSGSRAGGLGSTCSPESLVKGQADRKAISLGSSVLVRSKVSSIDFFSNINKQILAKESESDCRRLRGSKENGLRECREIS